MRLFFALWPSPKAARQLAGIAAATTARFGGQPTRLETLHLTLAFLGEVADERVPDLLELATDLHTSAFDLRIDQLGHWRRNHLAWAGCSDVPAQLEMLVAELRHRLATAGFAVANSERPFTPHVTLVRKIPDFGQENDNRLFEPIEWHCSDGVLVRSRLSSSGPAYETLARFALLTDQAS